ncbi:MAG: patatin-like phospholipase family protein [Nitrospinota bacterium]|nr:patatin-like phospholipase family protein [Nitrospinota bacterium]
MRGATGSLFISLLAATTLFIAPAPLCAATPMAAQAQDRGPEKRDYALTISGGISLGAYQAGFNWGFVSLLKRLNRDSAAKDSFNLRVVSGASAGNINAFLTALTWMEKDDAPLRGNAQNITNNWFYNTWIPVGLDTLFPGGKSCGEYYRDVYLVHFPGPEPPEDIVSSQCFTLDFDVSRLEEGERLIKENALGPENDWTAYRKEDGLFTRRSFDYIIGEIRRAASEPGRFAPGQGERDRLLVGVTVTSATPAEVKMGSAQNNIDIKTQHYVLPMEAVAQEDGLKFYMHQAAYDGKGTDSARLNTVAGQVLHLEDPANAASLNVDNIIGAIKASSAFPGAFSPVSLAHYVCESPNEDKTCGKGNFTPVRGQFTDGGIFDNVPLGLAVHQFNKEYEGTGGAKISYVYIDPDTRSQAPRDRCDGQTSTTRGLDFYFELVKTLVVSARQRELLAVTHHFRLAEGEAAGKEGGGQAMELLLSRRFSALAGTFMGAFGAFMDRPLREYDYYAGVYDSIAFFTKSATGQAPGVARDHTRLFLGYALASAHLAPSEFNDADRVVEAILAPEAPGKIVEDYLAVADKRALYVFLRLAQMDNSVRVGSLERIKGRLLGQDMERIGKDKLALVMETLLHMELNKETCEPEQLEGLVTQLRLRGYKDAPEDFVHPYNMLSAPGSGRELVFGGGAPSEHMADALENYDRWQTTSLRNAFIRLGQIEEIDKNNLGLGFMRLGDYLLRTSPYLNDYVELDPSSIPNKEPSVDSRASWGKMALHLFPYTLGLNVFPSSGWHIGYEPRIYISKKTEDMHLTLRLPVTAYKDNLEQLPRLYVGALFSVERLYWLLASSLRFGPEYYQDVALGGGDSNSTRRRRHGFSGSVQMGLLADMVSAGYRLHDDGSEQLFISVNNINGTLYWAIHMAMKSLD